MRLRRRPLLGVVASRYYRHSSLSERGGRRGGSDPLWQLSLPLRPSLYNSILGLVVISSFPWVIYDWLGRLKDLFGRQ
jgi:hypothetical protein